LTSVRGGVLALLLVSVLAARSARAHDETVSSSDVVVSDDRVDWTVDVGLAGLAKAGLLPAPEDRVTVSALTAALPKIGAYLARGLTVRLDGAVVPAEIAGLEPRYETGAGAAPALQRVAVQLRFAAPQDLGVLQARVAFFSELTSQHRALVTVRWGEQLQELVRLGPADVEVARWKPAPGPLAIAGDYLLWGVEHILIGYDHIAFLLALLLVARSGRQVLVIVTAFTAAHSLTLLLAALDLLRVPARLTEAAIALSIVYVAVENLLVRVTRHRGVLTAAFGLVHGLGFAGVLQERLTDLSGAALVLPVLSFNVGVELGQLAIVALVFPLLRWLRREDPRRQRLIVRVGSAPILLLGLFWLAQRLG
jgi:hydrogenase/urease accessory protein HupE